MTSRIRTFGAGRNDPRSIGSSRGASEAPSALTEKKDVAAKAAIDEATKQRRDTEQQLHPW
jgi:hypothetical protein